MSRSLNLSGINQEEFRLDATTDPKSFFSSSMHDEDIADYVSDAAERLPT